jgi:hypothetical protein
VDADEERAGSEEGESGGCGGFGGSEVVLVGAEASSARRDAIMLDWVCVCCEKGGVSGELNGFLCVVSMKVGAWCQ